MNKLLLVALCSAITSAAAAAETYNQPITAIFGSGNPNGGWTSVTESGLTLALRAKNRDTGAVVNNGADVYSYATGFNTVGTPGTRALWNYEFSINTGTSTFGTTPYTFFLSVDTNTSAGTTFLQFNPLTTYADNEFGTGATANGAGLRPTEAGFTSVGNYSVAQNSQNIVFQGLSPLVDATYSYELFAVAAGGTVESARVASVSIDVVVGSGGAAVPDSGSSLMMILGAVGAFAVAARRKNASR